MRKIKLLLVACLGWFALPTGGCDSIFHAEILQPDGSRADFWISDLGIEAPVPCDTSEVNSIFNEKYHGSAVILDGKCIKGMLITIVEESSSSNVFVCVNENVLNYSTCERVDPIMIGIGLADLKTFITDSLIILVFNLPRRPFPIYCRDYGRPSFVSFQIQPEAKMITRIHNDYLPLTRSSPVGPYLHFSFYQAALKYGNYRAEGIWFSYCVCLLDITRIPDCQPSSHFETEFLPIESFGP